jgi:hypothetical protein
MDALTCPWGELTPASISFCEARLCGWVPEPSNAWSNAAYLVPAWWVLTQQTVLPKSFQREPTKALVPPNGVSGGAHELTRGNESVSDMLQQQADHLTTLVRQFKVREESSLVQPLFRRRRERVRATAQMKNPATLSRDEVLGSRCCEWLSNRCCSSRSR